MLVAITILLSCIPVLVTAEDGDDDQKLFISVDDTKVNLISGNLTIAVTRSWPRVIFWHTVDPFSPTFDVGFPRLLLFNDTDTDGYYDRSEAIWTAYLDSNHAKWNLSSVLLDYSDDLGEYAEFSLSAIVNVYNLSVDEVPVVENWGRVTFWFCIYEKSQMVYNPVGDYLIRGGLDFLMNMTFEIFNRTHLQAIAIEKSLQGGGTTNMFHIREDGPDGPVSTKLSARVDETLIPENFTRPLNATSYARQQIDFAKEDDTVQAFYSWDFLEAVSDNGSSTFSAVKSSCCTNGAGLTLYSTIGLVNGTGSCVHFSAVGILEEGFVGKITDWIKEYAIGFGIALLAVIAVAIVALHITLRTRRRAKELKQTQIEDTEYR
jgi:hypothetical protein